MLFCHLGKKDLTCEIIFRVRFVTISQEALIRLLLGAKSPIQTIQGKYCQANTNEVDYGELVLE